jgi:hypothetical protein
VRNEKKAQTGLPALHLADEETTVESPASLEAVLLARRSRTAVAFPFREIIGKKTRLDRWRPSSRRRGTTRERGPAGLFLPETENARAEERQDRRGNEEERRRSGGGKRK